MNYPKTIAYLQNLELAGQNLGLERIQLLLKKLGNPQNPLKAIHVAGTNGKGSACAMISSILQEAGYKVGMYTSPHLVDLRERFLINNNKISEADFVCLIEKIKPLADEVSKELDKVTYFEFTTALMFQYFAEQKVDYAVIEVGLGGRLDATNVIEKPMVSVITNIDLEHTRDLGSTIAKIAYEKAGIIKEKIPVITAERKQEAVSVFKKICETKKAELIQANDLYDGETGLRGEFQKINAAVAIEAVKKSGIDVPKEAIKRGIEKVYWPARLDLRKIKEKSVLFDCAHNPSCIRVLVPELKKLNCDKLIMVIGILDDKDYKTMLNMISPLADSIILTNAKTGRSAKPEFLQKFVENKCEAISGVGSAVGRAFEIAGKNDLILITGSTYVVSEAMEHLGAKAF